MNLKSLGDLRAVQFEQFAPFAEDFFCASFARLGGASQSPFESLNTSLSVGDVRESVLTNRLRVKAALGCESAPMAVPSLSHGNRVQVIEDIREKYDLPETDAVVTSLSKVVLMINTADCCPIFFWDRVSKTIGVAHAGWRGIVNNIAGETIRTILSLSSSSPENILVGVGPCIGPCCYKVHEPEQRKLPSWSPYLLQAENGLTAIDLWGALEDQLLQAGIPAGNIEMSKVCTACNKSHFFSYWAEKPKTGRFPSAIVKR